MAASFDVIIPGLLQLAALEQGLSQNRFPVLGRILRYARRQPARQTDFEGMLADSLGLSAPRLSFARAFDEQFQPARSFICEAVHFKPDMRNAMVFPLDNSIRTSQEINLIIRDLSDFFENDFNLTTIEQRLWLLRLKQCRADVDYPHLLSVIGRKADPYIKQSREMLEWYQLNNEIQMYMHSHQVNVKRQQDGLATINGLWCWGGGQAEDMSDQDVRVYCNDFLTSAFLSNMGLGPAGLQTIADEKYQQKNVCLDLTVLQALKVTQGDDIDEVINLVESCILQPLLENVRNGSLKLRLKTGHESDYELDRMSLLKFWRKPASLESVIE